MKNSYIRVVDKFFDALIGENAYFSVNLHPNLQFQGDYKQVTFTYL